MIGSQTNVAARNFVSFSIRNFGPPDSRLVRRLVYSVLYSQIISFVLSALRHMARTLCSPRCSVMENSTQTRGKCLDTSNIATWDTTALVAVRNPKEMPMLPLPDQPHANRWQHSQMPRHFPRVFERVDCGLGNC
jgi:hypothetical protein